MLQRIAPAVATVVGLCAFISITMYSVYLNAVPEFTVACTGCGSCLPGANCSCFQGSEDINLWGVVRKNSSIKALAYIALFVLLAYAIGIVVERWLTYYYAEQHTREFTAKMTAAIYGNRIDEAKNLAALFPQSPLAVVVQASLQQANPSGEGETSRPAPSMEARLYAITVKTEELKRGLWNLSAVGSTVPLISFFIFIVSLIEALQGTRYAGGAYADSLADGLRDAIWPAIFSILVGVPVIWFRKYFAARLDTLLTQMDRLSLAFLSQIASPPKAVMAYAAVKQYDTQPLDIRVTHRVRN